MSPKVSDRALLARINRDLVDEDRQVRRTRAGSSDRAELGTYYVVRPSTNHVLRRNATLDDIARERKLLEPYAVRRQALRTHRERSWRARAREWIVAWFVNRPPAGPESRKLIESMVSDLEREITGRQGRAGSSSR